MAKKIPLYQLAHARTGDKGNRSNISVIAYRAEDFPILLRELTTERVKDHFSFRRWDYDKQIKTAIKILDKWNDQNLIYKK